MSITILQPGFCTTVQDLGRFRYQRFGMPVSGAMDGDSLIFANLLLDNPENTAALETTLLGPTFRLEKDNVLCVTGAPISIHKNGEPMPHSRAFAARAGDIIELGAAQGGRYSYIAFHGGLDVPLIMGSRSTCLKAAIGGHEGRKLQAGDSIGFLSPAPVLPHMDRRLLPEPEAVPDILTLRVLLGPQEDRFTAEGIDTFLSATFTVSPKSDRMGYRTEGPSVETKNGSDIITDGISLGAVQIPGDGHPIVMLSDRQTTGGYAKIAHVISADIPKIAQALPGQKLRFRSVSAAEAERLFLAQKKARRDLVACLSVPTPVQRFDLIIGEECFSVQVEML